MGCASRWHRRPHRHPFTHFFIRHLARTSRASSLSQARFVQPSNGMLWAIRRWAFRVYCQSPSLDDPEADTGRLPPRAFRSRLGRYACCNELRVLVALTPSARPRSGSQRRAVCSGSSLAVHQVHQETRDKANYSITRSHHTSRTGLLPPCLYLNPGKA